MAARCAGREPELEDPAALRQLGRFIGRLHDIGRRRPFQHRHHLDPRADGRRAMQLLIDGGFVPDTERTAWAHACARALDAVNAAFDTHFPAAAPLATLRLHGDCHLGNVLWRRTATEDAPHMVDLDDAMQGPAVQDLWMLVSGDPLTMAQQLDTLLEGAAGNLMEKMPFLASKAPALIEAVKTSGMSANGLKGISGSFASSPGSGIAEA